MRQDSKKTLALALLGIFLLLPPTARLAAQSSDQAVAEKAVESFLENAGDWGFSAAVWCDGQLAWSKQWGNRDNEDALEVTADTMFRIGSVSKVITAMALASMAERDEISLDATIDTYLADLPEAYAGITPRMLAGHLSGIRHYDQKRMREEYFSRTQYDNQTAALQVFIDDPLKHKPGDKYLYSTYGYTTLGAVMEQAAKQPLTKILRERVFDPAGMTNTFAEHAEPVTGELAVPYSVWGGREMIAPSVDNSGKLGGAGLVSTPNDLARFLGAVAEQRLVSKSMRNEVFKTQSASSGESTDVGLGWRIAKDAQGRAFVHHGGSAAGGRAFVLFYPDAAAGVALCMNLSSDQIAFDDELAKQVIAPFMNGTRDK